MVNLIDFAIANTETGGISHDVALIMQCIVYQNIIPPPTEKSARITLKIQDAHMGIIVIIRVLTSCKGSQYFHRMFIFSPEHTRGCCWVGSREHGRVRPYLPRPHHLTDYDTIFRIKFGRINIIYDICTKLIGLIWS